MVLYRPKRGEGMGREAAAEVIRGWGLGPSVKHVGRLSHRTLIGRQDARTLLYSISRDP